MKKSLLKTVTSISLIPVTLGLSGCTQNQTIRSIIMNSNLEKGDKTMLKNIDPKDFGISKMSYSQLKKEFNLLKPDTQDRYISAGLMPKNKTKRTKAHYKTVITLQASIGHGANLPTN